ncbi:MAG: EscU/YscU/HrcU family type III secretion system export apparatus switch protein [Pseudomonadota bacterium]
MSGDQTEEKTDPASEKKLRDLRQRGIIATAPTASELIGFSAALAVGLGLIGYMITRFEAAFDLIFDRMTALEASDTVQVSKYFFIDINSPLLLILGAAAAAAIFFKLISQSGFVFAMERVQPKLENVSPMSGLKKLVKGETLTQLLAATIRMVVLTLVCVFLAFWWSPNLQRLDLCAPNCAWPMVWSIVRMVLLAVAVLVVVSVIFDLIAQNAFFLQEQKMTKTEVKRERKDLFGQPEIRQERKRISRDVLEGSDAVGTSRAAIYFYFDDKVVAFAFHPSKMPLPKLAARAQGEAAVDLRQRLDGQGVRGFQHKDIVLASISGAPGDSAKRDIFMPLAMHLREVF